MAFTINTNLFSVDAQRNLSITQGSLATAMERLSSGLKINSAADDPAGFEIASIMTSQINGLTTATSNANNAVSLVQTTEGGLSTISDMLQRMNELAVQAADSVNTTSNLSALNSEFTSLISEIDRVAGSSTFNGQHILDGTGPATWTFQVGADNSANDEITLAGLTATSTALGVSALTISSQTAAQSAISTVQSAINTINVDQGNVGAINNRLNYAISNLGNMVQNLTAAKSRVTDADFASETANMTKDMILQQAGISVLAQANSIPQQILKLLP